MSISNNQIKGLIVGVIGVSTILYLIIYRKRKLNRYLTREEFLKENFVDLNTNFNHNHEEIERKVYNSVGIGRSDITRSISSRNSAFRESVRIKSIDDRSNDEINCGRLGLKSLDDVIGSLEEATYKIDKYENDRMIENDQIESHLLLNELRQLMEDAYKIRNKYKQKLIITSDSYIGSDDSDSSNDSFVSAREYYQDDSVIGEYIEASDNQQKYLFKAALLELENGNIYYRNKRTELVHCQNDTEYLAKLHCIRLAFSNLLENDENSKQLEDIGDIVGSALLSALGYDSDGFKHSYKSMIKFLRSSKAQLIIKEELSDKGMEVLSFYDIFFDFIIFDALESLENPPSSLVSIINNRWLSEGFKKTTLNSSVWTILLAKRKFLKHKTGFKAHFYDIIDAIGAPLAWSFLGPDIKANQVANALKDSLQELVQFIYSDGVRFTCEDELAEDIMVKFREVKETLCKELENIVSESDSLLSNVA